MTDVDVIIAGLGPTGATLAGLLGQRGVRVAVFDRMPDLFPLPRAAGLDQEAMRILQELGVAGRVAAHVAPYRPSEYRGLNGTVIKRLDAAPPPHLLGWNPNYVFEQPALENILRARLGELPAVRANWPAEVGAFGQDDESVWADVHTSDGATERATAKYLVACDGGSSPIRKVLGIALEDLGFDEPWLVVDAIVEDDKLAQLPQTQVQYCEPERPCTYVVGVGKHRRWELMLNPGDSLDIDFPEEQLWPLLARWIKPGEARIWRSAAYRFHGLVATQWRRGRILLAGDAAHMTPPFMTQGMVQGMRDALNLAWKLQRVVEGRAPETLLDSYEQERRPHVTATTLATMGLGRLICERDPARAAERDARLLAEQGGVVTTMVRQNLIPGLTGGLIAPDAPCAGTILPQPVVRTGAFEGRLDDLTQGHVRVVARGPLEPGDRTALLEALAPLDGVLVELGQAADHDSSAGNRSALRALRVTETEGLMASWFDAHGIDFAVARPDHYVYAAASTARDVERLLRRLRGQMTNDGA